MSSSWAISNLAKPCAKILKRTGMCSVSRPCVQSLVTRKKSSISRLLPTAFRCVCVCMSSSCWGFPSHCWPLFLHPPVTAFLSAENSFVSQGLYLCSTLCLDSFPGPHHPPVCSPSFKSWLRFPWTPSGIPHAHIPLPSDHQCFVFQARPTPRSPSILTYSLCVSPQNM